MSYYVVFIVDFYYLPIYSINVNIFIVVFLGEEVFIMNLFYNPAISFNIDNVSFSVSNIAREQFLAPVPKHAHGNESYELHYIASGYGTVRINNSTIYKLTPDTLYITGPHIEHEQVPYINNPMTEYAIFFNIHPLGADNGCLEQFIATPFWIGENAAILCTLLKDIFKELQHKKVGYLTIVSSLLQQIVIFLIRNYQTPRPGNISGNSGSNLYESRAFRTDKAFLYEYRDITLARLSSDLGLSERQTERFLKEYYGKTFAQKRIDARMSAACTFLSKENPNLQKISELTGYSSIDYFTSTFKKYYGITPKRYIQLIHENETVISEHGPLSPIYD